MKTRRRLPRPGIYEMTAIRSALKALNGEGYKSAEAASKMRELVADWEAHGRDSSVMGHRRELEEAARQIRFTWHRRDLAPDNPLFGLPLSRGVRPNHENGALLWGAYIPFFYLVESPLRSRLTLCSRQGCGKYFVAGRQIAANGQWRRGNKTYHARKCGHLANSIKTQKETRARAAVERLNAVDQAVVALRKLKKPPPIGPRVWVSNWCKRVLKVDVSPGFIAFHHLVPESRK